VRVEGGSNCLRIVSISGLWYALLLLAFTDFIVCIAVAARQLGHLGQCCAYRSEILLQFRRVDITTLMRQRDYNI
jgi:hypothetical protein